MPRSRRTGAEPGREHLRAAVAAATAARARRSGRTSAGRTGVDTGQRAAENLTIRIIRYGMHRYSVGSMQAPAAGARAATPAVPPEAEFIAIPRLSRLACQTHDQIRLRAHPNRHRSPPDKPDPGHAKAYT